MNLAGKILTFAAAVLCGCGTAPACDLEMSQVQDYMTSIDVTGMNLEQQLATRERALVAFHETAMLNARTAFLRRYNFKVDAPSVGAAGGGVPASH